ncbi:tRNA pseudouridine synthase 1 [Chytriomyces hyalinus]|nr:tRNA pseudouridine synthase 1 [Chytriomyces hyalinus]
MDALKRDRAETDEQEQPPTKTLKVEETGAAKEEDSKQPNPDADAKAQDDESKQSKHSHPKQRFAVLFGYCGTGYKGSQINPPHDTIESEFMKAAVKAGSVSEDNIDPKKVGLNRCARTDKGVHAAGNVVSLKMRAIPNLVEALNAHLPPQIRVYDCLRVTGSFNAKNHCGGRQYEYFMPTYILKKSSHTLYPHSNLPEDSNEAAQPLTEGCELGGSYVVVDSPETHEELRKFRVGQDELAHLREILKTYEGTHNFHNFTVHCKFKDRHAGRYITSVTACEPFVRPDGTEWISLRVNGQSFMLHQIRKMVGFAVMLVRTGTPANLVARVYKDEKINIPKAPALGLLLRKPLFDSYNKTHKEKHADRPEIDFEPYQHLIGPLVEEWINKDMYKEEIEKHVYKGWLDGIDMRNLDYAWWLTKDGSIRTDLKPAGGVKADEDGDEAGSKKTFEDE